MGLMLAGSLLFDAMGIWFISSPETFRDNPFLHDPAWIRALGMLTVVFFGVIGFFLVKKLGDSTPGLTATAEGFTDNSSALAGTIRWADVLAVEDLNVMGQKLLLVKLRNPEDYIARQPNSFKRQLMRTNLSSYGSPVTISANALQCTYAELKTLIVAHLQGHHARA